MSGCTFSPAWLFPLLLLIYSSSMVSSTHFRGGIIMARPQPGGTEYEMEISYHISWRRSHERHFCNSRTISSGRINSEGSLTCQYSCTGTISDMSYVCTSFSEADVEDWTFGERRLTYNFAEEEGQTIAIGFVGNDWIAPFSDDWNISTTFSLVVRNDTGRINSTPRAITAPVIRLREGCNHTIPLAVSDPDGDTIRCRKAVGRECAGICNGFPGAELNRNTCVIHYQANMGARYWAAAIMIEDFVPESPIPLSSVALQFLVLVIASDSSQACSQKPTFIQPTIRQGSCVAIPPEATFTTQLIANATVSDVSIMEIQVIPPLGTLVGELSQLVPNSNVYYVNVTWTPTVNQQNQTHMFCFTAVGSDRLTSDQNCIDLLPGFFPPEPDSTTLTSGNQELVHPLNTTWRIQFDANIVRPSVRADIVFHLYESEETVYRIDSSTSPEVTFEQANAISISPSFTFEEKTEYYITFDRGVVQGIEQCGPGSEPLRDKNYWTFVTMDISPPVITYLENASITNTNASFSWESNEKVTWDCVLVHNTLQVAVNCSEGYWRGYGLSEGVYRLDIRATDEAGNIGTATHAFLVDTTPPSSVTFVSAPNPISNQQTSTLSFSCNELCSFECRFTSNDTQASIVSCDSGEFTTPTLQPNTHYSLSVIAVDQVGNRADGVSYTWVTDFEPPVIFGDTQNTSATCENSSPESTGQAQAVDNRVEAVSLMYRDVLVSDDHNQCFIRRTWTAIDAAGNVADLVQAINLDFSTVISLLPQVTLPCDSTASEFMVSNTTAIAPNPCGLEVGIQLTYHDSQHICPGSFVRNWTVSGCDRNTSASQTIFLYDLCPAHACGRNESTPHGICSLGECQCNRPWYGEDCDILIYDPIAEDVNDTTLLEAQEYRTVVRLSQGSPPLFWSLLSGPNNLTVNQYTGEVGWSRAQAGNHSISVQIENQVNSTQVEWTLEVVPGYSAFLMPIIQTMFPYPQPVLLTGYVEFSSDNLVEDYLEGIVPVHIDIINNRSTRTIKTSTNSNGTFSVTFNPTPTEYGMYFVGARHPSSSVQPMSSQVEFGILGMKSIPRIITLNGEGISQFEQTFYNAAVIYNDGPGSLSGLTATPILPNTTDISVEIFLPSNSSLNPGEQLNMDIRVVTSRLLSGTFVISMEAREGTMLQIVTSLETESILPRLLVNPSSVDSRIIRGRSHIFQFSITNVGRATAHDVRAILPDVDLISFVSFGKSQQNEEGGLSLETGESALLTLLSQIPATQRFGVLRATIVIASSEASTPLPITLTVSSNTLMNLTISVEDEYTYFAGGRPLVNDAVVSLVNRQRNIQLTQSTNTDNGTTTFLNIFEDRYEIHVEAPSHLMVQQIVLTSINSPVLTVFIQRRTVTYTWSVTPTTFQDVYAISIEADFETRVPIPVVTVTPHEINLDDLQNGLVDSFQINITNHGLIRADDLAIQFPSHPSLVFSTDTELLGHLEPLSSIIVSVSSSRKALQKRNAANRLAASGLARAVNWVTYQINVVYSYVCNVPLFRTTPVVLKEPTICNYQLGDFARRRYEGRRTDPPSGDPITPSGGSGNNSPPTSLTPIRPRSPRGPTGLPDGDFEGYSTTTPQFCNPCISSVLGCLSPIPSPQEVLLRKLPYSGCIPVVQNIVTGNDISPTSIVSNVVDLLQCTIGKKWTGLAICAVRQNVFSTCLGGSSNRRRKRRTLRASITEVIESFYPIQQSIALGVEVLGDEVWLSVGDPQWLSDVLRPVMDDTSEAGVLISSTELSEVLSAPPPNGTTVDMVARMVNRINNTISGWNNGTLEPLEGPGVNMASLAEVQQFSRNINTYNDIAVDKGFSSFVDSYNFASGQLNQISNLEEEAGVCAVVRIRIQQELALTREAFLARLEIDNLEDSSLSEIAIDIVIIDLVDRSEANHLFSIGNGTLSGSLRTSDSGRWSLASDTTGTVEWLIVPYSEAAPDSQHTYTIGGSFSYIVNGENISMPLFPTPIIVNPDASLLVHYFLEKNVIADDPFTEEVETSIPFTLGIVVRNAGYGTAYDLQISSSQPEIIDNERGLLIDFMIIGANIGNERASPSLNVVFGDLAPNTTTVARWYMISSLQGEFSRYSATFENRNPLGDPRLSILDDLQVHELIRNVMIYTPSEDDDVLDFLVNDQNDYQAYPDALYSSKTLQKYNVSVGTVLSLNANVDSMEAPLVVRTSSNITGWVYYRYEDTQGILSNATPAVNGTKTVYNQTIELPPENSWITRD